MTSSFTINTDKVTVGNLSIPQVGLGTWLAKDNDGYEAVLTALKLGYRTIDTAAIYRNEETVGRAIKDSGIPRKDIFLISKLWCTQFRDPEQGLKDSIDRLGLDYVDLFLVHWPVALKADGLKGYDELLASPEEKFLPVDWDWDFIKTWELFQDLPKTGLTKFVGVSNFSIKNLEALLSAPSTRVVPQVHQIEVQPLFPQHELLEYNRKHGILTQAYSPLGSINSPLIKNATLKKIADKYGATIGQVILNWGFKRGYVVLPKSSNPQRLEQNLQKIGLTDEDFNAVSELINVEGEQRVNSPNFWSDWPMFE